MPSMRARYLSCCVFIFVCLTVWNSVALAKGPVDHSLVQLLAMESFFIRATVIEVDDTGATLNVDAVWKGPVDEPTIRVPRESWTGRRERNGYGIAGEYETFQPGEQVNLFLSYRLGSPYRIAVDPERDAEQVTAFRQLGRLFETALSFDEIHRGMIAAAASTNPWLQEAGTDWVQYRLAYDRERVGDYAPLLLELARDPGEDVRLAGVSALKFARVRQAVPFLHELIQSDDSTIVLAAADALIQFDDERGIATVESLAAHRDPKVRRKAIALLGACGSPWNNTVPLYNDNTHRKLLVILRNVLRNSNDIEPDRWRVLGRFRAAEQESVNLLLERLRQLPPEPPDTETRSEVEELIAIVNALADMGPAARTANPDLVRIFRGYPENSGPSSAAGRALAVIGPAPETIPLLLESIGEDPKGGWALAALSKISPNVHEALPDLKNAAPALVGILEAHENADALTALGKIGADVDIVMPLVVPYASDARLRSQAGQALRNMAPASVAYLRSELDHPDRHRRNAAIRALREMGPMAKAADPDLIDLMTGSTAIKDEEVFLTLSVLDPAGTTPAVVPMLMRRIQARGPGNDTYQIYRIIYCLGRFAAAHETARAALDRLTNDTNTEIRDTARFIAAHVNPVNADTIPALTALLDHPDWDDYSVSMVELRGDPNGYGDSLWDKLIESGPAAERAIPSLLKLLDCDPPYKYRQFAADAVGAIGPAAGELTPLLLKMAAEDPEEQVRNACVEALGKIGDKEAIPALRELLRNPSSSHYKIEIAIRELRRF